MHYPVRHTREKPAQGSLQRGGTTSSFPYPIPLATRNGAASRRRRKIGLDLAVLGYAALCLQLWGLAVASARAATLEVVPSDTLMQAGQVLTVDVVVSGLGNGVSPSMGSYDLTLNFDPAVLGYTGTTVDIFLGDYAAAVPEAIISVNPVAGDVNVFDVSLLPAAQLEASQSDSFRLFSITFDTLAEGVTGLDLSVNALGDQVGDPEPVDNLIVPVVRVTSSGSATAVPTMSSWGLLLLVGLLSALGLRRHRGMRS